MVNFPSVTSQKSFTNLQPVGNKENTIDNPSIQKKTTTFEAEGLKKSLEKLNNHAPPESETQETDATTETLSKEGIIAKINSKNPTILAERERLRQLGANYLSLFSLGQILFSGLGLNPEANNEKELNDLNNRLEKLGFAPLTGLTNFKDLEELTNKSTIEDLLKPQSESLGSSSKKSIDPSLEIFKIIQELVPSETSKSVEISGKELYTKFYDLIEQRIDIKIRLDYNLGANDELTTIHKVKKAFAKFKAVLFCSLMCYLIYPGIKKLFEDVTQNLTENLTVNIKQNYKSLVKLLVSELDELTTIQLQQSANFNKRDADDPSGDRSIYIIQNVLKCLKNKEIIEALKKVIINNYLPDRFSLFESLKIRLNDLKTDKHLINRIIGHLSGIIEFTILSPIEKIATAQLKSFIDKSFEGWVVNLIETSIRSSQSSPYKVFIYECASDLLDILDDLDPAAEKPKTLFAEDENLRKQLNASTQKLLRILFRHSIEDPNDPQLDKGEDERIRKLIDNVKNITKDKPGVPEILEILRKIGIKGLEGKNDLDDLSINEIRQLVQNIREDETEREKLNEAILILALLEIVPHGLESAFNLFQEPEKIAEIECILLKSINAPFQSDLFTNPKKLQEEEKKAVDKFNNKFANVVQKVLNDTSKTLVVGQEDSEVLKKLENIFLINLKEDFSTNKPTGQRSPHQRLVRNSKKLDKLYKTNTFITQDKIASTLHRLHIQTLNSAEDFYNTVYKGTHLSDTYAPHIAVQLKEKLGPVATMYQEVGQLANQRVNIDFLRKNQRSYATKLQSLTSDLALEADEFNQEALNEVQIALNEILETQQDLDKFYNETQYELDLSEDLLQAATSILENDKELKLSQNNTEKFSQQIDAEHNEILNTLRGLETNLPSVNLLEEINAILTGQNNDDLFVNIKDHRKDIILQVKEIQRREKLKEQAITLLLRANLKLSLEKLASGKNIVDNLEPSSYKRTNIFKKTVDEALEVAAVHGSSAATAAIATTAGASFAAKQLTTSAISYGLSAASAVHPAIAFGATIAPWAVSAFAMKKTGASSFQTGATYTQDKVLPGAVKRFLEREIAQRNGEKVSNEHEPKISPVLRQVAVKIHGVASTAANILSYIPFASYLSNKGADIADPGVQAVKDQARNLYNKNTPDDIKFAWEVLLDGYEDETRARRHLAEKAVGKNGLNLLKTTQDTQKKLFKFAKSPELITSLIYHSLNVARKGLG